MFLTPNSRFRLRAFSRDFSDGSDHSSKLHWKGCFKAHLSREYTTQKIDWLLYCTSAQKGY